MMPLTIRPLLIAALLPSAAMAQCPTAADMATGVRVTFDNGDTTDLRRLGGTLIEVTERYSWKREALRYEADYGVYVLREIGISPGGADMPESAINFTYPGPLPAPAADSPPWSGERIWEEYGMDPRPEGWQVGFRAMDPVVIGACTYDSVAVGVRLRAGAADTKDQYFYYLPELGAGFIVSWTDGGLREDTMPVGIEALR